MFGTEVNVGLTRNCRNEDIHEDGGTARNKATASVDSEATNLINLRKSKRLEYIQSSLFIPGASQVSRTRAWPPRGFDNRVIVRCFLLSCGVSLVILSFTVYHSDTRTQPSCGMPTHANRTNAQVPATICSLQGTRPDAIDYYLPSLGLAGRRYAGGCGFSWAVWEHCRRGQTGAIPRNDIM